MEKIDLLKTLKLLYHASATETALVDVPAMNFLMVDGVGDPNTAPAYAQAVEVLFMVSYTLKFMIKKSDKPIDYSVLALEGLWWSDDMSSFVAARKDDWKWTMMILQPECVTPAWVNRAVAEAARKRDLAALPKLRFEAFQEGLCAQIMHIGPYADEGPTIATVHAFISANGYRPNGKHHEIYLSDPRKTAPARMKTIIRQPIA